jgi:hypothetical protein
MFYPIIQCFSLGYLGLGCFRFIWTKMARSQEIPVEERCEMVSLREQGNTLEQIAAKFHRSPSAVWKVCHKYKNTESVINRPGRGRKRKTTESDDRYMGHLIALERCHQAEEVKQHLQQSGIQISTQTVRNRLKQQDWVARVKVKKPALTEQHRRLRLMWAKEHSTWTEADWGNVLWSDESKFSLFGSDGRQWFYKKRGSATPKRGFKPTVKFGGGHVMVWGCVSSRGVGNLCLIDGVMDSSYYQDILEDNMLESAAEHFGDGPFIFQQDNDPKHTSKSTTVWLAGNNIQLLPWCSQSPDLNPIEHVWSELERRIRKRPRFRTTGQLWEALCEEWLKIHVEVIKNLINSMPKRCAAVIQAKGWNTKY